MSRNTVRYAVAQFFNSPPVPGLAQVRTALEKQDQLVAQGTATPAQSFAVIYMPSGQDERASGPAANAGVITAFAGIKLVPHEVHLQVCHFFDGTGADAMDDLDALLEAVLTRLRSDARIGQTPQTIFEVRQGTGQIRWRVGETEFLEGNEALTWFAVMFTVVEQIQA